MIREDTTMQSTRAQASFQCLTILLQAVVATMLAIGFLAQVTPCAAQPPGYETWLRVQSLDPTSGAQIQTLRIGRGGRLFLYPQAQERGVLIGNAEFVEPFALKPTRLARDQVMIEFEIPQYLGDLIREQAVPKPGSSGLRVPGGPRLPVVQTPGAGWGGAVNDETLQAWIQESAINARETFPFRRNSPPALNPQFIWRQNARLDLARGQLSPNSPSPNSPGNTLADLGVCNGNATNVPARRGGPAERTGGGRTRDAAVYLILDLTVGPSLEKGLDNTAHYFFPEEDSPEWKRRLQRRAAAEYNSTAATQLRAENRRERAGLPRQAPTDISWDAAWTMYDIKAPWYWVKGNVLGLPPY
jgi:hypothetical protein